jgi:hypothetical protein
MMDPDIPVGDLTVKELKELIRAVLAEVLTGKLPTDAVSKPFILFDLPRVDVGAWPQDQPLTGRDEFYDVDGR